MIFSRNVVLVDFLLLPTEDVEIICVGFPQKKKSNNVKNRDSICYKKKKSQEEIRKEKSGRNTNPKVQTSSILFNPSIS